LGLGVSIENTRYSNLETGEQGNIWNFGFGGGFGGGYSLEAGTSTGNVPSPGLEVQARASVAALNTGVEGGPDIGANVGVKLDMFTLVPTVSGKMKVADNSKFSVGGSITPGVTTKTGGSFGLSLQPELSGTINVRYRTGILGDWLFANTWDRYMSWQRSKNAWEHERIMFNRRLAAAVYGSSSNFGSPSSSGSH